MTLAQEMKLKEGHTGQFRIAKSDIFTFYIFTIRDEILLILFLPSK